jgi:hypothetical protein
MIWSATWPFLEFGVSRMIGHGVAVLSVPSLDLRVLHSLLYEAPGVEASHICRDVSKSRAEHFVQCHPLISTYSFPRFTEKEVTLLKRTNVFYDDKMISFQTWGLPTYFYDCVGKFYFKLAFGGSVFKYISIYNDSWFAYLETGIKKVKLSL